MASRRSSRSFAALVCAPLACALALASGPPAARADDAPAAPGVARVSLLGGSVDVKRADSGDTVAAAVNAPLSAGDYLTTEPESRAEVQFDYGTTVRIAADTQVRFTALEARDHELQLASGTVDLRLFRGPGANATVQTPQVTVHPDGDGSTIVSVDEDGTTQVTVRSGRADIQTQASTQTLVPGSTLAISGDATRPQFATLPAVAYGPFDRWIAGRDRAFEQIADYRYVDAGMIGAGDLYGNGRWIDYPRYGNVWVPTVAPGWAPYRDGRFVWEPYYGWTWVDNAPWGWAPFHYGNWFYASGAGWAWYPGAYAVAQPYVYRPALVAFFSFGGGGLSLGFGNVGWVPIAPFEPFHPWWGSGYGGRNVAINNTTVVNNTTIVNNYNITKIYQNANAPGGANGTSNRNFGGGNFTHVRPLEAGEVARVEPVRGVVPIVPTARNLAFTSHDAIHPIVPAAHFATFKTPSAPQPSFAEQQTAVREEAVRAFPHHASAIASPLRGEGVTPPALATPQGGPGTRTLPSYAAPERAPKPPTVDPFSRFDTGARPPSAPGPRSAPALHSAAALHAAPALQSAPPFHGAPAAHDLAPASLPAANLPRSVRAARTVPATVAPATVVPGPAAVRPAHPHLERAPHAAKPEPSKAHEPAQERAPGRSGL